VVPELRPLTEADLTLLAGWMAVPRVARWWREDPDPAAVHRAYLPLVDGTDPTEGLLVVDAGTPVGFAQRYRVASDADWLHAVSAAIGPVAEESVGIDYLLGEEWATGRGLGRAMIAELVEGAWSRYPGAPAVVVVVAQGNQRSWEALEAVGFRREWEGTLDSADPSDAGPSYLYRIDRPGPGPEPGPP
jgi:aminoglycoside 6'-N-acetyltransferase